MERMTLVNLEELEQAIGRALQSGDAERLRQLLLAQHPADVADVIERQSAAAQCRLFELLSMAQAAGVLHELGTESTRQLLNCLSVEAIGDVLDAMPMDEVARVLTRDVPERQEELLSAMEPPDATEVRALLQYPPESAGRLMTEKFVRVQREMTVAETIDYLRVIDPEVETLTDLYVLDEEGRLVGVLSLRELMVAERHRRLDEMMTTQLVTVPPQMDQEEVAQLVSHYDFLTMPVVDTAGRMLGIITVDDIIHVLVEETTEDVLRFGAVEGGVINQPYFTTRIWRVVRTRVGWLLLLFLAETLTGSVLRLFEDELNAVVALTFFIPLLIGTGGNTGAQTVSTIIRGHALREIGPRDIWRVLRRELLSGLLLGLLLGVAAFFRSELWGSSSALSLVVALTILVIVVWANTIGSLIPLLAARLRIDPAVVSAPLITTLVDATGLLIYLLIAKAILGI
ncbi:MAG: magnesium transporter [Anaerolineae bacterium]|nr:magnesium transporter [Anaerolineae bacterium]